MKNFLGQDGFIWWLGIVEDNDDPLKLGRCRVRCFGYHPPIKDTAVKTTDLPWALVIHSPNTWGMYSAPEIGDWVFGFFLDAENAQEPAIMGIIPGIPTESTEYFGAQPRRFIDSKKLVRSFSSIVNYVENLDPNFKLANTIIWESKSDIKSQNNHGHFLMFYDEKDNEQLFLSSSNNHMIRMIDSKNNEKFFVTSSNNHTITLSDVKNDNFIKVSSSDGTSLTINDTLGTTSVEHKTGAIIEIDKDGNITISPAEGKDLNLSGNEINISGNTVNIDSTITKLTSLGLTSITSGAALSVTSIGATTMSAGGLTSITSGGITTITSGGTTTISTLLGGINLNSAGNVNVNGGVGVNVNSLGGNVGINATALVNINGALINLN